MPKKLFFIQDDDCPCWILADDYRQAIYRWQRWVVDQSEGQETMLNPPHPKGVQLMADTERNDTILTCALTWH